MILLVVSLVVVFRVVAMLASWLLWPATDRPTRADAIVVLSGDHGERLAKALPVMAGQLDSEQARRLCSDPQPFEVKCLLPAPDGTRPEARATGELAERRGWRRVVVVTTTQHVPRAKLLFDRCVDGEVEMVGASAYSRDVSLGHIRHEIPRLLYALVDPTC